MPPGITTRRHISARHSALAAAFAGVIEGLQLQWLYDNRLGMDPTLLEFLETLMPRFAELTQRSHAGANTM